MGQVIEEGRHAVRGLRAAEATQATWPRRSRAWPTDLAGAAPAAAARHRGGHARVRCIPSVRDELLPDRTRGLVNAYRHARAKQVEVELEYAPRAVRLLVRDDGVGVDPEVLRVGREGHYGLTGMRERAERIGGRLRL